MHGQQNVKMYHLSQWVYTPVETNFHLGGDFRGFWGDNENPRPRGQEIRQKTAADVAKHCTGVQ
jgi:hypothetical protein